MGTSPFHGPEEVRRRMQAYAAEWNAVAGCTDRADRPRAEAALTALYAAAGKPAPAFLWVASPRAGMLAYALASRARKHLLSSHVRGDIGNGDNREFNALAEPFGMPPLWRTRLIANLTERLPAERRGGRVLRGYADAGSALGIVTDRFERALRLLPRPAVPPLHTADADGPATDVLAQALGDAWTTVARIVGEDLARDLFRKAVRAAAAEILGRDRGIRDAVQAMQPGQWDAQTPVLNAAKEVFGGHLWRHRKGRDAYEQSVALRLEMARAAGVWWALDGLAIVAERPLLIRRDDRGRPHSETGPAIAWGDGTELHALHGVVVEPRVVLDPDSITVAEIDGTANVEVRRALIERFGPERLIRAGGARLVSADTAGRLWSRDLTRDRWGRDRDEPVVMVEVVNSTPEPDGTRKTYFLRVPPTMRTAQEAVAWTFGLGTVEYRPDVQT